MKNKKRNLILLITFILILGVFGFYKMNSVIDTKRMENLIETPYTATVVAKTKDTVKINIIGNITTNDLDSFVSKLYDVCNVNYVKVVTLNIFKDDESMKNDNPFYSDGMIAKISFNYTDKKASIGTFQTVPSVNNEGKTNLLNSDNEDKLSISVKDDKAIININTDLSDSAVNIVNQIKTYTNVFRDVNSTTDFKSVEVHINSTTSDIDYAFNTDFNNGLETIRYIKY